MGETVDVGRVEARDVEALAERLVEFVKPYQQVVGWTSREKQLGVFVAGLLGGTERKSVEPIALAQGVDRRQLIEALGSDERWLFVSNAPRHTPLEELVRAASRRHLVEEAFENAKGEVGLDHHEVRAWRGWHHHMTPSLMAPWFLVRERRTLGEESTALSGDGAVHDLGASAAASLTEGDRRPLPRSDEAERGGAHQPLEGAWPGTPVVEAWA